MGSKSLNSNADQYIDSDDMCCSLCSESLDAYKRKPQILRCGHSCCSLCVSLRKRRVTCISCKTISPKNQIIFNTDVVRLLLDLLHQYHLMRNSPMEKCLIHPSAGESLCLKCKENICNRCSESHATYECDLRITPLRNKVLLSHQISSRQFFYSFCSRLLRHSDMKAMEAGKKTCKAIKRIKDEVDSLLSQSAQRCHEVMDQLKAYASDTPANISGDICRTKLPEEKSTLFKINARLRALIDKHLEKMREIGEEAFISGRLRSGVVEVNNELWITDLQSYMGCIHIMTFSPITNSVESAWSPMPGLLPLLENYNLVKDAHLSFHRIVEGKANLDLDLRLNFSSQASPAIIKQFLFDAMFNVVVYIRRGMLVTIGKNVYKISLEGLAEFSFQGHTFAVCDPDQEKWEDLPADAPCVMQCHLVYQLAQGGLEAVDIY